MKVFISWSGPRGRAVAAALNEWLPRVMHNIEPFYSAEIEKGTKWSNVVDEALKGTAFGILCLTQDNAKSEWIHYEAGALSKTSKAMIWTFLLDLKPEQVSEPLAKFQHTHADLSDVRKLLHVMNRRLERPIPEKVLDDNIEVWWPTLSKQLEAARGLSIAEVDEDHPQIINDTSEVRIILEEMLELMQSEEQKTRWFYKERTLKRNLEIWRGDNQPVQTIRMLWEYSREEMNEFLDHLQQRNPRIRGIIIEDAIVDHTGITRSVEINFSPTTLEMISTAIGICADICDVSSPEWFPLWDYSSTPAYDSTDYGDLYEDLDDTQ